MGGSSPKVLALPFLVDEDERALRPRQVSAPVLDEDARDPLRRRQTRDHDKRGLLPRRQRRKAGRLLVPAGHEGENDLKQRAETHAT